MIWANVKGKEAKKIITSENYSQSMEYKKETFGALNKIQPFNNN